MARALLGVSIPLMANEKKSYPCVVSSFLAGQGQKLGTFYTGGSCPLYETIPTLLRGNEKKGKLRRHAFVPDAALQLQMHDP